MTVNIAIESHHHWPWFGYHHNLEATHQKIIFDPTKIKTNGTYSVVAGSSLPKGVLCQMLYFVREQDDDGGRIGWVGVAVGGL